MGNATFTIDVRGGGDVTRVLTGIRGEVQRTNAVWNAGERNMTATQRRALAEREAAVRRSNDAQANAKRRVAAVYARVEADITATVERETRAQGLSEMQANALRVRLRREAAAKLRTIARQITADEERESRRRVAIASREGDLATGQRRGPGGGGRERRGQSLGSALSAAAGLGRTALTSVGAYGDDVRERMRAQEQLDMRAMQIASGGIGTAYAAPELSAATRRTAETTGLDPAQILDALNRAQEGFSQLGNAADRARYLNEVLPMLARTAVATGGSLEDLVGASGEMQRQLGISGQDLPRAIAQQIAQGRLGSISFGDESRHLGVLAGGVSRFTRGGMEGLGLTGALFQTAGAAGGGGDVSATRARAFLDNITSDRGRRRLTGLLGRDAFDAGGQIVTRRGETQNQAFTRAIEEAWARSGGDVSRFGTAVGGVNTRSRALTDQFARDLRAHGGRLTSFRGLLGAAETPEGAINAPFQAVANTDAVKRAIAENRFFYQQTTGPGGTPQRQTDRDMRALREYSPFVASLYDNPLGRGALDVMNVLDPQVARTGGDPGAQPTARQRFHAQAVQSAETDWNGQGWFDRLFSTEGGRQNWIQQRAGQYEQQMVRGSGLTREQLDRRTVIDPGSMQQFAQVTSQAVGMAVERALNNPQAHAFNSANAASGANPPPPENRR